MTPWYKGFKVIFCPLFNKYICRTFHKFEVHTPKTSLLIMSLLLASTMFGGGMRIVSHAMIFSNSGVMGMRSVHMVVAKCHYSVSRLEISPNMDRVGYMDNPSAILSLPSPFRSPPPIWSMSTPIHKGV